MDRVEAKPVSEWSDEELIFRLYQAGDLTWKMLPHQLEEYKRFDKWNKKRQTREERRRVRELGAKYDHLYMWEWGRRTGKTANIILIAWMLAYKRPGCRGMIFTGKQKNIGGILMPLVRELFADAPPGFEPVYRGTHGADHEGLWIDAVGSYIKLVGTDMHPGATRGQFLDFAIGTEAAFVEGLEELILATINPQMMHRPWAFLLLESSTAIEPDHDFNKFREDCRLRDAYTKLTIDDNPSLSQEDREMEILRCGGPEHPTARRELYCEEVRDQDQMVCPEFNEKLHVIEHWDRPSHALAYTFLDPGNEDMCGVVCGYVDWLKQVFVVEYAWGRRNRSSREIADVVRLNEERLWGVKHRDPDAPRHHIVVEPTDVYKPGAPWAPANDVNNQREKSIAGAEALDSGRVWSHPHGALTYWDDSEFSLKPNPYMRVSDSGDPQGRTDLNVDHGLAFSTIEKSLRSGIANLQHARLLLQQRRLLIMKNGQTEQLIAQMRSGMWNEDHTKWLRTTDLGHLDCFAALILGLREVNWKRNPFPPSIRDVYQPDMHYPDDYKKHVSAVVSPRREAGPSFARQPRKSW